MTQADAVSVPMETVAQPVQEQIAISAERNMQNIQSLWERLEREDTSFIYQRYEWVRLAYKTLERGNTPLIVHGSLGPKKEFLLPLVVEGGLVKTVRWPGGKHANICCGIYSPGFLKSATPATMRAIVSFIARQISGVSVLRLNNQPPSLRGFDNPLMALPGQLSQNVMFEMPIANGMDAVLDAGNGKRKRKLFRRQVRVAEELGGYEFTFADEPEDIRASLADFYEQKAQRFSELGVSNVFAPPAVKEFVEALALAPEKDGVRLLRLYELKVAGKTRALYGCAHLGSYAQAWINSVTYDEFSPNSPGEMILYLLVEHLIDEGFQHFDLGVGSERYKVSWCKDNTQLTDLFLPLSVTAYPVVGFLKAVARGKAILRNNDHTWNFIKRMRRLKAKLLG